jgi:lipoprotein-releasing system permease protein
VKARGLAWRIAMRYLWSGRKDAAITIITVIAILGVTVGVITLNVVMAVMTGFEVTLREKILGADAHIVVRQVGGDISDWRSVLERIKDADQQISSVSPYTSSQALIRSDNHSSGVLVRGIAKESATADQLGRYLKDDSQLDKLYREDNLYSDSKDNESNLPGIIIGRELARSLGVFVGSRVSLLSSQVTSSPFGLMPRYRRFKVVGIYQSGLVEYESGLVYVALQVAQQFFRIGEASNGFSISGAEIRLDAIDKAPAIASMILNQLGSSYVAQPWTETNRAFFEALRLEKRVYFTVLLLIVVMASFSIVSSLVMIVVEKRRDIGILRTLGISASDVGWIFRIQGAVIGGVGVGIGTLGGIIFALALQKYGFPIDERIFQMATLPIHLDPSNVFLVAISAFGICAIATYYPASKASRVEPIEVIRYD